MTKPMVTIQDIETGEIVEREMNDTEYAEFQNRVAADKAAKADQAQKDIVKQAVLDKLGLTTDEVAALLS